ncbi:alpha/beta hydrolase [Curtobacterium sp. SORGH_AS_0776]|uniref:alpha/beta hydrolase n=1 Tax=Curtobacterium sp. SORGH_AS_0776 TaxID=3041798 RepID=UPI0028606285|nr:alpha/beta hydrolase [Curtobacterium sp. SORGH_AS_0776]MDR6170763.1 acetyl esterase [Curtobacterium sp. SORGH_AS_0776]
MGGTVDGPHGPVPVRRYAARRGTTSATTVVWLHGGGFFRGSLDLPEAQVVASTLADRGLDVVTVGYRLAPLPGLPVVGGRGPRGRRRHPVPNDEVRAVLEVVRGETDGPVLLGGASAGACLAAAVTRTLPDAARPDGLVLAYGFFHARTPRDAAVLRSVRGHRRLTHHPALLDRANWNHLGRAGDTATAFPGGEDLSGFPRTLMVDAEHDTMRASGDRFADELRSAGVAVDRHVLPAARHAFLNRPGSPDSDRALDLVTAWAARSSGA